MKKLIIASLLLGLTACGEHRPSREEEAVIRQRDGEQATALFKEMSRFAKEDTTVICISGVQYLAWIDYGSTVQVHHMVPLFDKTYRDHARGCTGGPERDLDHPSPGHTRRQETTPKR